MSFEPPPPLTLPPSEADRAAARVRRERDLYLRLLELMHCRDVEPLLREGLALIVQTVDVARGYLELIEEGGDPANPRWSMAHNLSSAEIEGVRREISHGIIGETIARSQTITTASACDDPRFSGRESVKRARIEAVLCAPIGSDPPRGVLYLQGRSLPGPFSDEDRVLAETFCRHLAPLVDGLGRRRPSTSDRMQAVRQRLRATGIVGSSDALAAVLEQVAMVAPLTVSVLLTGETGTGKSHFARVLHENSRRASGPFVELNCAALPEQLIESELFGALAGAHSTATKRVDGKIAAAERGTLFLDEVSDLPPSAQAKLLQVLQSKQYYPLGASRPVLADVRVIAATNVDLAALVAARRFREDLFYRLQVLPLRVPPLAERRRDIVDLATFFCAGACKTHGLPAMTFSPGALRDLELAEWPGNVRQLCHAVEAAAIRAAGEGLTCLESQHLFPESALAPAPELVAGATFQEHTRRFQKALLHGALDESDWNVAEVARRLDLARSRVYELIRLYGLQRSPK